MKESGSKIVHIKRQYVSFDKPLFKRFYTGEYIMCGRYAVYSKPKDIAEIFAIKQSFRLEQSYNIAPTELVSVICGLPDGSRAIIPMRWGLIPSWQNPPNMASALINARIETVHSKPSFKQAALKRRCLIIADGFYEWQTTGEKLRQPYFIHRKDRQPIAIAGIWEKWTGDGTSLDSCCIITLDANVFLSSIHNRMPAIIKPEDYDNWLDIKNQNWEKAGKLLTTKPHESLTFHAVATKVNSARYKNADCILPLRS